MPSSDWLLEVGVDTRNAKAALTDFKKTADELLGTLGKGVVLNIDTKAMTAETTVAINKLKASLATVPSVNLKFNLKGATTSLNKLADSMLNNRSTIEQFTLSLGYLNDRIDQTMGNMARLAPIIRESAEAVRTISTYMRNAGANTELASRSVQVYTRAIEAMNRTTNQTIGSYAKASAELGKVTSATGSATKAHKSQHDVIERLGKILDNTVFKFVEYEVIMRAFNGVVHEFTSSLNQASNVQFESTLQHLYAPTINLNNALSDAIIIAKQYGSDITDVQQAIGLWTKVTQDETSAAYLAIEAEKLRRISGIETLDVFKDSVAVLKQMGLAAKDLPDVYDQIAAAALRIAEPLKAMGKGGSEGVKDMMDGLTRFGAVGKGIGLDTTGIIALTANQVQAGAEGGKESGSALSNMVGALDTGSKSKANFDKIIGPISGANDYEKSLNLMKQMEKEAPKLAQAMADGLIRTKPGQVETFKTLEASIKGTIELMEYLHSQSKGKLDLITDEELKTFQGRMDQLKASVQSFSLAFGQQLLPAANSFAMVLANVVMPALQSNIGAVAEFGHVLISLGGAVIVSQMFTRLTAAISEYRAATNLASIAVADEAAAERMATLAGFDNMKQMQAEQQEARILAEAETELRNAIASFGEACGASGAELATFVDEQVVASKESGAFGTAVNDSKLAMERASLASGSLAGAFGGVAAGALRSIGPLAALTAGIWAVTTAMEGLGKSGAASAGLDDRMEATLDKKKNIWQKYNPLALAQDLPATLRDGAATLSGNDSHGDDYWNYANSISHNKTDKGRTAADVLGRIRSHKDDNNQDQLGHDYQVLKELGQQHDSYSAAIHQTQEGEELQKRINAMLNAPPGGLTKQQSSPGGATTEDASTKTKGASSPESQVMGATQRDTKDAQSRATDARDTASAEKELAAAILERTKATGISTSDIKDYTTALKAEQVALNDELNIRKGELASLNKDLSSAQADQKAHPDLKTTAGQHAANNVSNARANIEKTTGAIKLLTNQYQLLVATNRQLEADMQFTFDVNKNGLNEFSKKIEEIKRNVANQTGFSDSESAISSGQSTLQSALKRAQSIMADPKVAGNQEELQKARDLYNSIKDAVDGLAKSEEELKSKAEDASQSLLSLKDAIVGENAADIGKALGIDTGDLDALNTTLEQYKKIQEEIKSAKDDYDKSQQNAADQANYQGILKEIQYREQLIPILAQEAKAKADIKKVEDSKEFKTINSAFDKLGNNQIDKAMSSISKKGAGGAFVADIVGGELKDAWSSFSKSMTDGIFNLDKSKEKEKSLQEIYQTYIPRLETAMQNFKESVDKLLSESSLGGTGASAMSAGTSSLGTPLTFGGSLDKAPGKGGLNLSNAIGSIINQKQGDEIIKGLTDPAALIPQGLTNGNPTQAQDILTAAQATADNTSKSVSDGTTSTGGTTSGGTSALSLGGMLGGIGGGSSNPYIAASSQLVAQALGGVTPGTSKGLSSFTSSGNPITDLTKGGMPALNQDIAAFGKNVGWGTSHSLTGASLGLGLGVGSLVGTLMGGGSHDINGEIGGAIGSVFGPVGSVVGGAIGGLFGHVDSPAAMPDKYDPSFGQEEANLNGSSYGAQLGGTKYLDQNVAGVTGGQGEIAFIEEQLSKYSSAQAAPTWLQPMYQQLMGTFGESTTGSGKINYGTDIANEFISGAAGASSQSQNYQDIVNQSNEFMSAFQAHNGNVAQAPILSINAFGSNGAYGNSIYNTPGLTSSQFNALQQNSFGGSNLSNYYATPGVGTSTASGANALAPNDIRNLLGTASNVNITTNLQVDGQVLATVVNAANAAMASRTASS